ncbi:MAG TPA: 6-bladed beta-propeller [Gammaproteobacteria bacterium]|nr:6-bladed beta-propeller [Gammaproteobacteria bacterium]
MPDSGLRAMLKPLYCLALFAAIVLSGCAASKYKFEYRQQAVDVVWPPEPELPRIRYLGVIQGDGNFKKIVGSEGFGRKSINWFGQLLFGEAEPRVLHRPQGGAVDDENQRIFVADVGNRSVFVFDFKKNTLNIWEGVDSDTAFLTPIAVCLLSEKQIFVSDADLGYVAKFDADGKSILRLGEKRLSRPTGLACDKKHQKVYVADSQRHKIDVFSGNGEWLYEFGRRGSNKGEFNSPTHLGFSKGKLYVSDTLNARVQVFDEDGNWLESFGKRGMYVGDLPRPKGIAVDSEQHIYVIESYYDHLLLFDEAGRGLLAIGGSGEKPGQFNLPAGIWIDSNDVIYVADMFNRRIVVFQYIKQTQTAEQIKN